jgi:anti-sigma regulatory factor (Ser/Thr protein kinase)
MQHDDRRPPGYRHVGHLHTGEDDDLGAVVLPLLRRAVEAGDRVVLACPEPLDRVLSGWWGAGDEVSVLPAPGHLDTRPAAGVAAIAALVDRELPDDGRRLHLVTAVREPGVGWAGSMQTEALLNHVLADRPVDQLCLLWPTQDGGGGDPGPAELARTTHPHLLTAAGVRHNPDYREPAAVVAELQRRTVPDPLEAGEPVLALLDLEDMRTLRRSMHRVLADSPLDEESAEDFVLAIDEIVANAAEHGLPPVDVRLWCGRDRMLCTITDRGPCFDDPLAGYGPAHGDMAVGGMGLWLARRSVDSLVAAPSEEDGSGCTVRLAVNAC